MALLRGSAACPLLSGLGEHGLLDRMVESSFTTSDFPEVADHRLFHIALTYLISLGLLHEDGQPPIRYEATTLGRTVFRRYGACALLHSYRDYFERLPGMIVGADREVAPRVDRRLNVLGSGQLHSRKFFTEAYRLLANHSFERLIDVGCGNGQFIEGMRQRRPGLHAVGVDLSEIAATEVRSRFDAQVPVVIADGGDVAKWHSALPADTRTAVVSLWFIVHEFSLGKVDRAVRFFTELHQQLPNADVIVGEIVNLPATLLAIEHAASIMPEFQLFHSLSGQGVFTWEQHQQVLGEIPYSLKAETLFDELPNGTDGMIPSSFVWHLCPQNP